MAHRLVFTTDKQKTDKQKSEGRRCSALTDLASQPPPEDQLGGGDICSLEETPSTEDDKPLD